MILKYFFLYVKTMNETNKENLTYMDASFFNTLGPHLRKILDLVKEAKNEALKNINSKKNNYEIDEEDLE